MEEIQRGMIDYLKIFFRRKWFLIIPGFIGLVAGTCIALLLPKEYISSTKLLVQEEKNDNPLLSNIAVSTSASQRMQTIRDTMLGWQSLTELIRRLHMDKHIFTQTDMEMAVKKLRTDIEFRPDQNIIEISYISTDPHLSQAVVKTLTDIFIARNVAAQQRETDNAIKFIEEQLHVYLGKIKSAEIADLNDKLNALLIDSTEMHPQVVALRREIRKRMQEMKEQGLQYTPETQLATESVNPMISQIQAALSNIGQKDVAPEANGVPAAGANANATPEKDLYKVMLMDKLDTVMARDVGVNETLYNNLLQRLETAKITQRLQSSSEGTRYTIIEEARVPTKPAKPNRILIGGLGLTVGLVLGTSLLFLMEFMDRSFLDVQEASAYLGVPLLGAISKINTPETIRIERNAQAILVFWLVTGGSLMVYMTVILAHRLNLQG